MNHPPLSADEFAAYRTRIGMNAPLRCDLASLHALHHLHPLAIAFESLESFCGGIPSLEPAQVFAKLVKAGRGGYCFEQNQLFWRVLRTLGFQVKPLAARVLLPDRQMPRTHMVLLVTLDGIEWLADVGFGGMTMTAPLRLDLATAQDTPHERWQVQRSDDEYLVSAEVEGEFQPKFRVALAQQIHEDYEMANWVVASFPTSRFRNELIAARPDANGRHALGNKRLSYHRRGQASTHRELGSAAEAMEVLQKIFGITTGNISGLSQRLTELFGS